MNTLMIIAIAVVLVCYCGSKYCPKILSSNKELVLGVLVGLALCSFAGLRLEGLEVNSSDMYRCGVSDGDPCGRLLHEKCFREGTEIIPQKFLNDPHSLCNPNHDPGGRTEIVIPKPSPG